MSQDIHNGSILAKLLGFAVPLTGLFALIALCSGDICSALGAGAVTVGLMYGSFRFSGGALNPALHDVDELDRLAALDGGSGEGDRMRMAVCIIRLGLLMAAADGNIDESEIKAIQAFFRRHGAEDDMMQWVDHNLVNATRHFDADRTIALVNQTANREEKDLLLLVLLSIALADGSLDPEELAVFFGMAEALGLTQAEAQGLIEGALGIESREDDLDAAWSVLGLEPGASPAEVKATYRKLARQYHPDRVAHLGPEFTALASERMQAINDAHARIQAHQGR